MIGKYLDYALMGLVATAVIAAAAYVWHLKAGVKRAEARAEASEARAGQHAMAASQWEANGLQARVDLAECQAQWEQTRASAVEMIEEATRKRIQAEKRESLARDRWNNRPVGCRAALEALDSACPDLRGY
jgi:hypothetical protein